MTVKAIYSKKQQSYSISNVNYWLQILSSKYNINKTILTPSEINSYNEKILSDYVKTEVMDVLSITGTKTQSYVKNLITAYSNINKYTVYNDSTKVSLTTSEKDTILSNRNLTNIPSTVGNNWKWRIKKDAFNDEVIDRLKNLTRISGRL